MANELERAELYLCLARSFLPPSGEQAFEAMRDALPDDLEALCKLLGHPAAEPIEAYRRAMASIRGADELGRVYSQLFAAPPRLVYLNAGMYLDGSLMGASAWAMDDCYRRCGVERCETFRNLPDHVSAQLEFVAFLYATGGHDLAPGHFLGSFVRHWLPAFADNLEQASRAVRVNPYLPLSRILASAVARDAEPLPRDPRQERRHNALLRARRKRASRGVTADDMREIMRRLEANGLPTDHLKIARGTAEASSIAEDSVSRRGR